MKTILPKKVAKRRPAEEHDRMIAKALKGAGRPVSAYEIIDHLKSEATLAPQTVYRALDRLIAQGAAHRLESLNAFVACCHETHGREDHVGTAVFAICNVCGHVNEFSEQKAISALAKWAEKTQFTVATMTLELRGICSACASATRA